MPLTIKNLDFIRNSGGELGPKLAEALQSIQEAHNNIESQTNSNSTARPEAPPAISAVNVSGQNGHFNVAIHDDNPIYSGVNYYVEHADNPQFTNSHTEELGATRNTNLFLGNTKRYFRAYSAYGSSPPSAAVYHGGIGQPTGVEGGGDVGPPAFQPSQSSGTGLQGQALQGPGVAPYRSINGKPPPR